MSMTKALLINAKPTAADIKLLDPSEQKEMLELKHRTAQAVTSQSDESEAFYQALE